MNSTHQKFLKYVLGVRTNCCNIATIGELGEYPLLIRAWVAKISYWHRSTQMMDNTLVKKAVKFCMENDIEQSEYLSTIKMIMGKLDLNWYFENPSEISTDDLKELCTNKLEEKFRQEWQILLNGQTGTLRFYKTFKKEFEREKYLDNLNCFQLRKIVTKFRCSNHRLEIERGRHLKNNTRPEDRICLICRGSVENLKLRSQYLGNNVESKIAEIIQPDDKETAYNLANYLTKATELREYMLKMREYFI